MGLNVNSNEKLLLTFQETHCVLVCLCYLWRHKVPLPLPDAKAISFRATIPCRSQGPSSWESVWLLRRILFKLGGTRERGRSSVQWQSSWEQQQHLLLPRNSLPFRDVLPQLEVSTWGRGLYCTLSWAQGKEKEWGIKRERSSADEQSA